VTGNPDADAGQADSTASGRSSRASESRRRRRTGRIVRRLGAWLLWWVVLMSLWVILDNSIASDELLAGAGAAALGACLAEAASYQAATRFRMRIEWLIPALSLPGQVVRDTVIVFGALWRRLARGQEPASGFRELPVRYGSNTAEGKTRRALYVGGQSVAPNTFALGIDRDRDVMIVHQLVVTRGEAAE
jgi:multisubunit Na+/H+ antiporter MnhE subunit